MPTLDFVRRARVDRTDVATRSIYRSRCNRYRVVYSKPLFSGLPRQWRAEVRREWGWDVLSKHRSRLAAEASCVKHLRSQPTCTTASV